MLCQTVFSREAVVVGKHEGVVKVRDGMKGRVYKVTMEEICLEVSSFPRLGG